MNKFIIFIMTFMILLVSSTLNVVAQTWPEVIKPDSDGTYEYKNIRLNAPLGRVSNVVWTGREYIFKTKYLDKTTGAQFFKSSNFEKWEAFVNVNDLETAWAFYERPYQVKYFGNKYIVYDMVYETPTNIIGQLRYGQTASPNFIYTLDENFNLINKASFENPVTAVRYINGKYYLQTQDYKKIVFAGGVPDNIIYDRTMQ